MIEFSFYRNYCIFFLLLANICNLIFVIYIQLLKGKDLTNRDAINCAIELFLSHYKLPHICAYTVRRLHVFRVRRKKIIQRL